MRHKGGCHCGKVKFEADIKLEKAISCNCSICMKRGSLLDFIPESQFQLLSGQDDLASYHFHKKHIQHLFCKTCGILSFAKSATPDGTKMVAVNLRCIEGIDLGKLQIREFDGRSV